MIKLSLIIKQQKLLNETLYPKRLDIPNNKTIMLVYELTLLEKLKGLTPVSYRNQSLVITLFSFL